MAVKQSGLAFKTVSWPPIKLKIKPSTGSWKLIVLTATTGTLGPFPCIFLDIAGGLVDSIWGGFKLDSTLQWLLRSTLWYNSSSVVFKVLFCKIRITLSYTGIIWSTSSCYHFLIGSLSFAFHLVRKSLATESLSSRM